MNIQIKKPCTENWDKMTPTSQGRFCDSCQENVVDFTSMSAFEIKTYLAQHKVSTCGNIHHYQLENFNAIYNDFPSPSNIKKWSLAAIMAGLITSPSFAQVEPATVEPFLKVVRPSSIIEKTNPIEDSIILAGRVEDKHGTAISNAVVYIEHLYFSVTTDEKGAFSTKIPASQSVIKLSVRANHYMAYFFELLPNKDPKELLFQLELNTKMIKKGRFEIKNYDYDECSPTPRKN